MTDKLSTLMNLSQTNSFFDPDFGGQVSNVAGDLSTVHQQLIDANMPDLATSLAPHLDGVSASTLGTYVSGQSSSIFTKMSKFSSYSSVQKALGNNIPCSGITQGFGATLGARGMLSSVDTLKTQLTALPGLKTAVTTSQTTVTNATAALVAANNAYASAPSQVTLAAKNAAQAAHDTATTALTTAQGAVASATTRIQNHVGNVTSTLSGVSGLISDETNFHAAIDDHLTSFASAMQVQNMFENPCLRGVLGAVGSPDLLDTLNMLA
jgi:hypothetical protein